MKSSSKRFPDSLNHKSKSTVYRIACLILLLIIGTNTVFPQTLTKKQLIKAIQEADAYFYYDQDYEKAAEHYKPLADAYPDNANLSAKLGISYLNVDGKRADALRYLKKAVGNVTKSDKEYVEYGDAAPLDTYLYIAIAYQQNDSLEKAATLFSEAKRKLSGYDLFSIDYINGQIKNCSYAIEAEKKPFPVQTGLFIPWLKEYPGAMNPVLAKNDSVFLFTQKINGKTRVFCSYKNGKWKLPSDITSQLGGMDRFYTNSITGDGKLLIIYMDDGDDGNLYYSLRKDTTWSKIRSIGKEINTIYWEAHGFITPDGQTLYYSSNMPGGKGELDIWTTTRDKDGKWRQPVNCGNVINTPYNENTPFFNTDNKTLLFSSSGHTSLGGYDVFRSVYNRGSWSHPTGLPYPVNRTIDDSFIIFNASDTGYVTSYFDEKAGYRNIYSIVAGTTQEKKITAEGTILTQDGNAVDYLKSSILLTDAKTGVPLKNLPVQDPASYRLQVKPGEFKILISQIGAKTDTLTIKPVAENENKAIAKPQVGDTGMYSFVVAPGDYIVYVKQPGYKTDTVALNLPAEQAGSIVQLSTELVPEKVSRRSFLMVRNILFDFDSYQIDDTARANLDILRTILTDHPDLKIEITGYTDSRGSDEHNMRLAGNRADAVIAYLVKSGVPADRLIRKVAGNTDFAAMNTNVDGTDNPDGRKYNRRATFGVIDPKTGISINLEGFTPRHLRHPSYYRYSIVLMKSEKQLTPDSFSNLELTTTLFINPVSIQKENAYVIGEFLNKIDAVKYLTYAREKGFRDAYIVNQYDFNRSETEKQDISKEANQPGETRKYTIQLAASRQPMKMSYFKEVEGVREIHSSDNYYRYVTGDYPTVAGAKPDVIMLREAGFKDAFIRNINSIPK
jgi:outer membrane protein OmpA-like peptidoglycan-associated protein